jgi:large subunit ribosomal protein L24
MKKEFSTQWNASKQPRKQRKYLANAPTHIRHKLISATLSKELRKKYGKRNFPLRKGDEVLIMRGEFRGKTGKIELTDLKKLRVMIGGIYRTKKDGTKVSVYFESSNLKVKELNLDDKRRLDSINRKAGKASSVSKETENSKNAAKADKKQGEQHASKKK